MLMKKILFFALAIILGGCVPSLHPLYTDKDTVFEEKLLGKWGESESYWKFNKGADPNSYDLTIKDDEGKGDFTAHLVKIDEMMFLDIFPEDPESLKSCNFWKACILPVHLFLKVEQTDSVLKMKIMDMEKLQKMLQENPSLVKHEVLKDRDEMIILTAATKELQEFMKKNANTEGLFVKEEEFKRIIPTEPKDVNSVEPNSTEPNDIEEKNNLRI